MYKLVYTTIGEGPWLREWNQDPQALIALADAEQYRYDSCHIEDGQTGREVWEPSLGMMNDAVSIYQNPSEYPNLMVPQHVIIKAVETLAAANHVLPALTLIRGAYRTDDGAFASLAEAEEIYLGITGKQARHTKAAH